MDLSASVVNALRQAASCVTGAARRSIQAMAALNYCGGSSRHAETVFGWNRHAVASGIKEAELGAPIQRDVETRGSRLVEVANPELANHVDRLCGNDAQVDPKFQTVTLYTRMTGESLRAALAESLSIPVESLPVPRTLRRVMNRRSFSLKRIRKTIPKKKIPQTDAIFDNVKAAHQRAQRDKSILRISVDCKARVKIGPFSRGGKTRNPNFLKAADHDMGNTPGATPCGILEVESGQVSFAMNTGTTTSDSIVDALENWWQLRGGVYPEIRTLMIDLDNGPDVASNRSVFIKRLTQFADRVGLKIELVYYPPYHSKYNAVERCWSALERHWNGSILKTIEDVIHWAETMTWKKIRPIVWIQDQVYARGVRLSRSEKKLWSARLNRREGLEPWSLTIEPLPT